MAIPFKQLDRFSTFDHSDGGLIVPHSGVLPASGVLGQTFFDDDDDALYIWDSGGEWMQISAAAAGEANTASNQGTAGVGVFIQKTGVDLEFKNINAGSAKITVSDDAGNNEIDIDVDESELDHGSIGGLTHDDHSQYVLADGSRNITDSAAIDWSISSTGANNATQVTLGGQNSGNRIAVVKLVGDDTYTDFGARFQRNGSGANSNTLITHRGTGDLELRAVEAGQLAFLTTNTERMRIDASGDVTIAQDLAVTGDLSGAAITGNSLDVSGDVAGATLSLDEASTPAGASNVGTFWVDTSNEPRYTDESSADYYIQKQTGNVFVQAAHGNGQTIANNTQATVVYEVEVIDDGSDYNPATGIFTAPVDGYYQVHSGLASDSVSWPTNTVWALILSVNNSSSDDSAWRSRWTCDSTHTGIAYAHLSALVKLSASDTLRMKIVHNRGSSTNCYNGGADEQYNFFHITLVKEL